MTRRFRWLMLPLLVLALGLGALPFDPVSQAEAQGGARFWLNIKSDDGSAITDSTVCRVRNAGLRTEPTIYTTARLNTAATNPVTANTTTGDVEWYLPTTTASVDVDCYVGTGQHAGAAGTRTSFTRTSEHTMIVSRPSGRRVFLIPMPATASTSTESVAATLPAGTVVTEAVSEVVVAGASGNTFNFGAGTSSVSVCETRNLAVVGFSRCAPVSQLYAVATTLTYHNTNHTGKAYGYVFAVAP